MATANPNAALQRAHEALIECQVQLLKLRPDLSDETLPPIRAVAHAIDALRFVLSAEEHSLRLP